MIRSCLFSVSLLVLALAGCTSGTSSSDPAGSTFQKSFFGSGKFDSTLEGKICADAGLPPGCDICDALGYYGDGECDTFCAQADSDCGQACVSDINCPAVYCITTPCPQPKCIGGECRLLTGCEAQDATGTGLCEAFFGYAWNGFACTGLSGCSCEGADCGKTFGSQSECEQAYGQCFETDPCDAQDAGGTGPCQAIVGYVWDGKSCTSSSGCTCTGKDCDSIYQDAASCEAAHSQCNQGGGTCAVGGCSGQLCYDPATGSGISTCEWRPEYACFKEAICERQNDGQCGWTETPAYSQCIGQASCPQILPPAPGFCGDGGPKPTPVEDVNGCIVGFECPSYTDCRDAKNDCGSGSSCQYCWGSWQCMKDGWIC
ncbi:MAG: hypothetical protein KC416_12660 [Myxococcales bacterium]|nr:hypothetical protein [Myxococcales bacterium]